jgi:hypothetical protein
MIRPMPSRAVASERQDELSAIAQAGKYLSTGRRLIRRARVAALDRDRTADDSQLLTACRAVAEARRMKELEEHIRRVVDAAPPLTAEQRDKLALLLRGSRL